MRMTTMKVTAVCALAVAAAMRLAAHTWSGTTSGDVTFSDAEGDSHVDVSGTVSAGRAIFEASGDMTMSTNAPKPKISALGAFIKRGKGTLTLDPTFCFNYSTNTIIVEEGTYAGGVGNQTRTFGDAMKGFSVEVMSNATFWVKERNCLGSASAKTGSGVKILVHTNGTFSLEQGSSQFNITFFLNTTIAN